jgi:hypothetical protein
LQEPEQSENRPRKSPRSKEKGSGGKSIIKLAQDLVAKKCGIIKENEGLENLTLQQYLDMYKKPLDDQATEAILKLTEVAIEKGKKVKKDMKDKKKKMKQGRKKGSSEDGKVDEEQSKQTGKMEEGFQSKKMKKVRLAQKPAGPAKA